MSTVGRNVDYVPGAALPIVGQIDEVLVVVQSQGHLVAVERPGAEFHLAALIVKGEPGNVYLASALEYAGRHV